MKKLITLMTILTLNTIISSIAMAVCTTEVGTFACGYTNGSDTKGYFESLCIGGSTVKDGVFFIDEGKNPEGKYEENNFFVRNTLIDKNGNFNFDFYNRSFSRDGVMRLDYILYRILEVPKNWESTGSWEDFEATIYVGTVGSDGKIPAKEDMNKKTFKMTRTSCFRR